MADWLPIDTAPREEDLELLVRDDWGTYGLVFLYRLTRAGWVSSVFGAPLAATPIGWRKRTQDAGPGLGAADQNIS